jgi:hypothetical protein
MLNIEYSRTYFIFPYNFISLNLVFWKFQHFWKVVVISVKIAKYPVIFLGRILVTWWPENGTATFTKYLL